MGGKGGGGSAMTPSPLDRQRPPPFPAHALTHTFCCCTHMRLLPVWCRPLLPAVSLLQGGGVQAAGHGTAPRGRPGGAQDADLGFRGHLRPCARRQPGARGVVFDCGDQRPASPHLARVPGGGGSWRRRMASCASAAGSVWVCGAPGREALQLRGVHMPPRVLSFVVCVCVCSVEFERCVWRGV